MNDLDLRVRNHVYAAFVRHGEALPPQRAAEALGVKSDEAAAAYRRLHDAHALVLDSGDPERISMLHPFSTVPTSHVVEAVGRAWFANCAWDALGIPAALYGDGIVRSRCEDCGEPVELEVRDGRLARGADLLAHFVVPARHWWDDIGFT